MDTLGMLRTATKDAMLPIILGPLNNHSIDFENVRVTTESEKISSHGILPLTNEADNNSMPLPKQ